MQAAFKQLVIDIPLAIFAASFMIDGRKSQTFFIASATMACLYYKPFLIFVIPWILISVMHYCDHLGSWLGLLGIGLCKYTMKLATSVYS